MTGYDTRDGGVIGMSMPYPHILVDVIKNFRYRDWTAQFRSECDFGQGCVGPVVLFITPTVSSHNGQPREQHNLMPVPITVYTRENWVRWLWDQVEAIERHERGEAFVVDGMRPFFPAHGPGADSYTGWDVTPVKARDGVDN